MLMKRELYLSKIRNFYDVDLIKVITGIRRSGKSKILEMIMMEIKNKPTDNDHIIYINFENFEFEWIDTAKKLHEYLKERMLDDSRYYLFFDEIQHVTEFERILASLKATKNCSIFITGSNSKLLSGELATLLTGRTYEFKILPFTYKESIEYLKLINKEVSNDFINDYIKWGGFPQRFDLSNDYEVENYLKNLYDSIIRKDILKRNIDVDSSLFKTMSSYILANAGKEFSAANIANFYNNTNHNNKLEVEKRNIYNYVDKMEKAFFISRVKRYLINGKEILKSLEKHYAIDMGLRTINTNTIQFENTFYLENIVYNELITRGYNVYTGKTYKGEVDFVVIKGGQKCFIQIAYLLASTETITREFGAFSPIKDASPKFVMSLDQIDMSRDGITHINIIDFLLDKKDIILS